MIERREIDPSVADGGRGRTMRRHVLMLVALCAVVYATGLTVHGLMNWQESQRVVVAREMQQRGDWVVPTMNGRPYLAKPPLMYWCQLALAELTGREVGIYELRLTVALAGLAGVLCTYFVARRLLGSDGPPPTRGRVENERWVTEGALWSALALATGALYVRSSRTGELDILLAPFVVLAAGAIAAAWRTHRLERRANWWAVAGATLATTGAALTKGPPGVMVVALAGYGGIALWAAFTDERLDVRPFRKGSPADDVEPRPSPWWANFLVPALCFILAFAAGVYFLRATKDIIGLPLLGVCGAVIGLIAARLVAPRERGLALFTAWSRTHPVLVLGAPLAAVWAWGKMVAARVGDVPVTELALEETDNLRLFEADSPIVNLGASAFGVGLGSIAAIAAVVWLAKERPRWRAEWWIIVAWVGLGLVAFSIFGKGVQRYLTPLWPGIAILGGMFMATLVCNARRPRVVRAWLGAAVIALGVGQAWWYGYGREVYQGARSPAALVSEIMQPGYGIDPERLVTFEFRTPAVDYYAGRWVQHVGETGVRAGIAGGEAWTLEEFTRRVEESGEVWGVLMRREARNKGERPPIERLRETGLAVQTVPAASRYVVDRKRNDVEVARVWGMGK